MHRAGSHILVVDDNAQNRALARGTLEDEGFRVSEASSGEEALTLFEATRPDCVLLDVRMPGTDGFAVCARMRALPGGDEVRILFFTALRDVDTFDHTLRVGGDDFLTKPLRPTELVLRVQSALKIRRMSAELRESYDLVRRQRDDLMRLQLQKDALTAFVVHDLKNPVHSMLMHAELILEDPGIGEDSRESTMWIREDARSLLRLVLNLLDISKSEEGHLAPRKTTVDLQAVVTSVFDAVSARARARDIILASRLETPSIVADVDLMRRVIENLVENALRYAPPHSEVRVTAARRDGAIEVRVADSGAGVPAAQRERIFERFAQLDGGAGDRTGRGLGLAFCKLVVEAHGGTVRVEDSEAGAVFLVRLPDAG